MVQHVAVRVEWERLKESGEGVRIGSEGVMVWAPRLPHMEKVPIMCHCHQMCNPQPNVWDTKGSTCIIQCTNKKTGDKYGVDPVSNTTTCPSCRCTCLAAFEVCICLLF